jgi:hypothetical protein
MGRPLHCFQVTYGTCEIIVDNIESPDTISGKNTTYSYNAVLVGISAKCRETLSCSGFQGMNKGMIQFFKNLISSIMLNWCGLQRLIRGD